MAGFKWKSVITGLVVLGAVAANGNQAQAQWSSSISAGELLRPWEQHLAVLQSLSGSISTLAKTQPGMQISADLLALEADIEAFGQEVDEFLNRLAADPQFVYVAADTSRLLSIRLGKVHTQFDSVYLALGVAQREDIVTAQASLEALRKVLHEKRKFENDVTNALGSGARQPIVALAVRFWNSKEKSIEVRKVAANLRQQFAEESSGEEPT